MSDAVMLERKDILQALARGYCVPGNTKKEIDTVLLQAMADEVMNEIERAIAESEIYLRRRLRELGRL